MSTILDAMSEENAVLRQGLERAELVAVENRETIRTLRERVEAGERLVVALELRAAAAELRIHRAAEALDLPAPTDRPLAAQETSSAALH